MNLPTAVLLGRVGGLAVWTDVVGRLLGGIVVAGCCVVGAVAGGRVGSKKCHNLKIVPCQ